MDWRERLRRAVELHGESYAEVGRNAGISPSTLRRILTDESSEPKFETVVSITHAVGENVGWLLGEPQSPLTEEGRARMQSIVNFLAKHFPQLDRDEP